MKKLTVAIALFGFVQFNVQAKLIEVSVVTEGLTELQAREKLKLEARWHSTRDLPLLVSGSERVNAFGDYSREVTALSAAALDIKVLTEFWDKEAGILTSKLEVTQNTDLSEHVFGSLMKNDVLKKQLNKAYESLDKIMKVTSEYDLTAANSAMGMLETTYNVLYMRNSFEGSLRVKALLESDYESYVLNKYITPYINSLEPVGVDVEREALIVKYGSQFYQSLPKSCMELVNGFFFQRKSSYNKDTNNCVDEPLFNQLDLSYKKKWSSYISKYKDGEITIRFNKSFYGDDGLTRIMNDPVAELRELVVIKYNEDSNVRW